MMKTKATAELPPHMQAAHQAMLRAAEEARRIAIQTNTGIVVVRNGKLVEVSAEELKKEKQS